MTIETQFQACVGKARALAAFPSGSHRIGDQIVSAALDVLGRRVPMVAPEDFTIMFFREIAKAIIDKPFEISSDDDAGGRAISRFSRLAPRERLAFFLVEFSLFSDEMAAKVLDLDLETFDSLLTPAYRTYFQGISMTQPESSPPAAVH